MNSISYRCGECHIDVDNRRFSRGGAEVALEPKAFALIVQFLMRPDALVTRNELIDAIWGHRYVTPSTLNRLITLVRRAFGDDSEVPRFIQTVHGSGYRYIGPVERHGAAADLAVHFGPPPIARLPARIDSLIGRESELTTMSDQLRMHRAVTVLGTGGIGKTQCALECARRLATEFVDGVWFFDLAPFDSDDDWVFALAGALAIPPDSADRLLPKIAAQMQGRQLLLLMDNCDRIAAKVGARVFELLRATDTKVLATLQAPLSFRGEQMMRMPPLALPTAAQADDEDWLPIRSAAAVQMLVARIQALQPTFELSSKNARTIAEICIRLDGMPLALELAAARFVLLSAEQVLARLEHRLGFLSSDIAGRDDRHRNLVVLLDWSFSLLSAAEQQLLCWFSVFVQGWSVHGAMDLAVSLGSTHEAVIDLLGGLVNKSMVSVVPGLGAPRYQLLETVRDYAAERLRAAGEESMARDAHLAHVVRLCLTAHQNILAGQMIEQIRKLEREHGNITAAVEYACGAESRRAAGMSIVGHLMLYIKVHTESLLGPMWCHRALEHADSVASVERAWALLCLAVISVHRVVSREPVETLFSESIRLARLHNAQWVEGFAEGYWSLWQAHAGVFEEAERHAAKSERIARQLAEPVILSVAALARSWIHIGRGEYPQAILTLEPFADRGYDINQQTIVKTYIGLAQFAQGDYEAAARQWQGSMKQSVVMRNVRGIGGNLEGCAYLATQLGFGSEAAQLLGAARKIRERTGMPLFRWWTPFHEAAHAALRSQLGTAGYEAAVQAGEQMRVEDAVNAARAQLHRIGGLP